MLRITGRKTKFVLLGSLLVAMLTVGLVTAQAAAGGNGKGKDGGNGSHTSSDTDVRGSKQDPSDPCLDGNSPCGRGDHGQGNPVNGSLHANCNAAQGEVDPICDTTTTPTPEPTPDPTSDPS